MPRYRITAHSEQNFEVIVEAANKDKVDELLYNELDLDWEGFDRRFEIDSIELIVERTKP